MLQKNSNAWSLRRKIRKERKMGYRERGREGRNEKAENRARAGSNQEVASFVMALHILVLMKGCTRFKVKYILYHFLL